MHKPDDEIDGKRRTQKLGNKTFRKVVEDFVCEKCGTEVKGSGYTDHCPNCLWSKHVDIYPGDRASKCKGMMKPVYSVFANGEFEIVYKCEKCKTEKRVTAAPNDNRELLIAISSSHSKKGSAVRARSRTMKRKKSSTL